MTTKQKIAYHAVLGAQSAMRNAMRVLEELQNSDEITDSKKTMVLADFADTCLSGGDQAVDVLKILQD